METSGQKAYIANIDLLLAVFAVSMIFVCFKNCFFGGSLQTSLLCIVVVLAGEGSVAVAVGVRDM